MTVVVLALVVVVVVAVVVDVSVMVDVVQGCLQTQLERASKSSICMETFARGP